MKEFFETIKEKPKGDCSAAYLSMRNCINSVFYGCKNNNTDLLNLTKIAQRAQVVIGSEKHYCRDGMLNSFKGINLQPDCQKKAKKKLRKCTASFHKEFSEDKASRSLCRKYTKAKKCVVNVLEKFCKKTARIQHISQIYNDPFNPYCPGSVDTWKPQVRDAPIRFGACSARDYFILTRICMVQFIQTLQKYPKKPCRLVHCFLIGIGEGREGGYCYREMMKPFFWNLDITMFPMTLTLFRFFFSWICLGYCI